MKGSSPPLAGFLSDGLLRMPISCFIFEDVRAPSRLDCRLDNAFPLVILEDYF